MTNNKTIPGAYAQYVQTLVEYDGPQVVLLESRKGGLFVCVPIDEAVEGFDLPFLAAGVSKTDFKAYLEEAYDLNYLMEYKSTLRTYVVDISKTKHNKKENKEFFSLKFVEKIHADRRKYLPDQGFFARNHTSEYKEPQPEGVITHTYYIDGRWTTADFSRFYARLSDLYAIYAIAEISDDNLIAEEKLESAITSYTFKGGGSYRNSFKDIGKASNDNYPLKVSRIQYASPGRIDVRGIEAPLTLVDAIIDGFDSESDRLKEAAKQLYLTLQRDGALGNRNLKFSNKASEAYALKLAGTILGILKLPNAEKLLHICADRPVVFAKLALALYRRAVSISKFYEEGRVSLTPR